MPRAKIAPKTLSPLLTTTAEALPPKALCRSCPSCSHHQSPSCPYYPTMPIIICHNHSLLAFHPTHAKAYLQSHPDAFPFGFLASICSLYTPTPNHLPPPSSAPTVP